jgi:hypothetical protein
MAYAQARHPWRRRALAETDGSLYLSFAVQMRLIETMA